MRRNRLRDLKASGTPIVNAWMSIASPYAAEVVAHAGYDSVTVDCQHGMMGFETAVAMMQAISATAAIPMVRPTSNDPAQIMRLLDGGAYGVICPMISTADDAARLVSACRYQPAGTRSFGPARGLLYGGADYLAHANEEILVLAMIETEEGVRNIDDILAVPGIDGIYVGPNDLALAMGRAPSPESADTDVRDAIEQVRAKAVARGLIAGIFCSGGPASRDRIAQGFDLVTPGNDAGALRAAAATAMASIRGA